MGLLLDQLMLDACTNIYIYMPMIRTRRWDVYSVSLYIYIHFSIPPFSDNYTVSLTHTTLLSLR